ncbi:MAG TPA: FHA domain-containing protein [Phycisphaerae bacterium]|nr:FHA domain-containing protein [Phycisphaerae bacterium]
MAEARPELVFLSGPQQGERAVLMGNNVVAGRLAGADVRLTEEYVSRRHVNFRLTRQGWVVESLSATGMRVNEKRYKPGQVILLATGDVLAVGKQTRMLFVGPEDDPDEALKAYREAHPQADQAAPEPAPVAPEVAAEEPRPAGEPAQRPGPPEPAPAAEVQEHAVEGPPTKALDAEARKKKLTKYAVGFGIYLVIFVGFIVLLISLRDDRPEVVRGPLRVLKRDDIERILTERLARSTNPAEAEKALQTALTEYHKRTFSLGGRYRCLTAFKQYLAYQNFNRVEDDQKYKEVLDELKGEVAKTYEKAIFYEQTKQWAEAEPLWERLLKIVPEEDPDSPVHQELVKNIKDHWSHVSWRIRG